ncbi:MAG: response regulator [Acidobacteriota bacterium]|nr:response regulator [Acidobacteriota bacterium]
MAPRPSSDRVLLIDDDLMSREVLTVLLHAEGFAVEAADSGDAALLHIRACHTPPTVILCDIQMPGLAGAALAHALRGICPPQTLLLAMSGSGPDPSAVSAFDGFLTKPFQPRHLLAALVHRPRNPRLTARTRARIPAHGTPPSSPAASNPAMSTDPQPSNSTSTPILTASPETPRELDERIYKQLEDAMPGLQLHQMYSLCLEDVRHRIATMRTFAEHRENDLFTRQAHAIKGGCGMLGASELYDLASRLEKAGLNAAGLDGNRDVNPLDELAAACDRLERILETRT